MKIVIDTTVVIAVVTNEETKDRLVDVTLGAELLAPTSLDVEVGNALSRMFKRNRIDLESAERALDAFLKIPIRRRAIDLPAALKLSHTYRMYAYDAYVLDCALKTGHPILTLDGGLLEICRLADIKTIEVSL